MNGRENDNNICWWLISLIPCMWPLRYASDDKPANIFIPTRVFVQTTSNQLLLAHTSRLMVYLFAVAWGFFSQLVHVEHRKKTNNNNNNTPHTYIHTQFLLHQNAIRLLNSIAQCAMVQASYSTSNTHSRMRMHKRTNERMKTHTKKETEKKELNQTVRAYK